MTTWREYAAPIIAHVIESFSSREDERLVRKALTAAYPFGERKYWPYKVWLSEVKRQMLHRQKAWGEKMTQVSFDDLPLFRSHDKDGGSHDD